MRKQFCSCKSSIFSTIANCKSSTAPTLLALFPPPWATCLLMTVRSSLVCPTTVRTYSRTSRTSWNKELTAVLTLVSRALIRKPRFSCNWLFSERNFARSSICCFSNESKVPLTLFCALRRAVISALRTSRSSCWPLIL